MREHRDALVGSGRAAIGIGRRDHHDGVAVLQRVELLDQELGLRSGLPGVRHDLRGRFRIAGHRVELDVDPGRDHEAVIGNALAAREHDLALVAIDRSRGLVHELHPLLAHLVVAMGDRLERAVAADIDVREEAGGELLLRLDQRDVDRALQVLVDIARDGAAAGAASDHHQLRLALAEHGRREQRHQRGARERGETATCQVGHDSLVPLIMVAWFWRNRPRAPRFPRP